MTEFTGHTGEMRDSPWLASEDIKHLETEPKVEIEAVHRHTDVSFDGGRKKPVVFTLAFKGRKRQLVLNATNRKILTAMYGTDTTEWVGKEITLYVQTGIKVGGEVKDGLRIRGM
jgi:hypothetical protein